LIEIVVTTQIAGHRYGRRNGGDTVAAFREWQWVVESATCRRAPYATAYTELYATAYKPRPARRA
jgi:hypothetical protein